MTHEFSNEEIESIKDSLSNIIDSILERLSDKYLSNHCSLVEEQLIGYDNCSYYRKVYNEESQSEASQESKKAIKEALKQLGF